MEHFVDAARRHTFSNFDVLNFLKTGALVKKEHQVEAIAAKRYGKDLSLKSDGVPTFVMTAVHNDHECINGQLNHGHKHSYKPFILRTYDYPRDTVKIRNSGLVDGSSDVKFYEACAATSAVPGKRRVYAGRTSIDYCVGLVLFFCLLACPYIVQIHRC